MAEASTIPLHDRIAFLEAAVECARIMYLSIEVRGFDTAKSRVELEGHYNGMLETLSGLYLERSLL